MGTIPVGSGLAAQIVAKDETTYGVAPPLTSGVDSFEIKSETLELKKTAVQGEGLAAGHVYHRTKRRVVTNYDVTGDIAMELPTRNLGFWLRHMVGDFTETPTQIGTTGIYKTVFQPKSNMQGHSFCVQKGVPAVDATVAPFTYVGCKLASWTLNIATGAIGALTVVLDGRNELGGPAPSTPAVPASATPVPNTTAGPVQVVITGGTMTNVVINGVSVGVGAGTYTLPAGQSITLTYTVAPTWAWSAEPQNGDPLNATVPALATFATPTTGQGTGVFHFREATIFSGGVPTLNSGVVSLVGATALANVKDVTIQKAFTYDVSRMFIGNQGFKSEQIENAYRALTGSLTAEWLSSEALYAAYASDLTTSLQLTFTGPSVSTSNYLLDIIIPNIKFEGETPKIPGPSVITQAVPFTGLDDEATVPLQITYQSEDSTF